MHYHYGHNVAGYLPESDVFAVETAEEARAGLADDLKFERDGLDYAPADEDSQALYDSLGEALDELNTAADVSQGFSTYTSDGGEHRIPTAWWIQPCYETDCELESE